MTLTNLLFIAAGITIGIVIGAIPGLGSVTALAVLIPITYYMSPLSAIAFLVGVNKGGTSGGAIPAILLNAPGTPEAAATALDGYPMAQRGQANRAMRFALYSSVTGDTVSDCLLIMLAAPFAAFALNFGTRRDDSHIAVLVCTVVGSVWRLTKQESDCDFCRGESVDGGFGPDRQFTAHDVRSGQPL